jgi:hypothetical protein
VRKVVTGPAAALRASEALRALDKNGLVKGASGRHPTRDTAKHR